MIYRASHHPILLGTIAILLLAGCKSSQDAAIDEAKHRAAITGQAQQVVSVDKNGTTTTIVHPPVPGQTGQAMTTTLTPAITYAAAPTYAQPPAGYAPQAAPQSHAGGPISGAPVIRPADVNVPAGTALSIRINQHISVKTTPAGARFTGELETPVAGPNNLIIIPRGARVEGIVDVSHRRGHFKGRSLLELRLTSLELNGTRYPLETHDLTRTKKGKGKRSAAFIGGGTGLGMLIGGVASGGTGLLIGGLAGAGAGTALGGFTGNRDIDIPAESVVNFKLADTLVLQP